MNGAFLPCFPLMICAISPYKAGTPELPANSPSLLSIDLAMKIHSYHQGLTKSTVYSFLACSWLATYRLWQAR